MDINQVLGYITGDFIVARYYPSFKEWQVTKETCEARRVPACDAGFKCDLAGAESPQEVYKRLLEMGFPEQAIIIAVNGDVVQGAGFIMGGDSNVQNKSETAEGQ